MVGVDHTFPGCNNISDCIFIWLSQNLALRCICKDGMLGQKGGKLPNSLALQQSKWMACTGRQSRAMTLSWWQPCTWLLVINTWLWARQLLTVINQLLITVLITLEFHPVPYLIRIFNKFARDASNMWPSANTAKAEIVHDSPYYFVGTGNACHFGCACGCLQNGITLYSLPHSFLHLVI
jgi:hypothetical protein